MALSVQFKRIDVTDETQTNPVSVEIQIAAFTDQADVANVHGSGEIQRFTVRATTTRAVCASFLQQCTVTNKTEIPAAVLALLSPPLTVP